MVQWCVGNLYFEHRGEIMNFDANPDIWRIMNILWGKHLDVELIYGNGSGFCCDVLNSFATTFSKDSMSQDVIRIWGANGKSTIVDKAIISERTLTKVNNFAKQYHSIGNIMPLPNVLNSPHSGRANFNEMGDYFDNFLDFVKCHLNEIDEDEPKFKLKLNDEGECYFKKFSYREFVEAHLLQPFFSDSEYKKIKKLDFRKFLSGEELMNKFIDQSLLIIKKRELLIALRLKEMTNEEEWSKIRILLKKYSISV